ncbi:MAG: acyl carrier protein [Holophagaceae bacterium]|nr:acyl carrier protein [Holophagaceae bacterium]
MDVRTTVRAAVQDLAQAPLPADDSVSLFERGVIDSFGLVDLMLALEQAFHVDVPDSDLIPSRFETVEKIMAYFQARL